MILVQKMFVMVCVTNTTQTKIYFAFLYHPFMFMGEVEREILTKPNPSVL